MAVVRGELVVALVVHLIELPLAILNPRMMSRTY
jgi:hypothetical protein